MLIRNLALSVLSGALLLAEGCNALVGIEERHLEDASVGSAGASGSADIPDGAKGAGGAQGGSSGAGGSSGGMGGASAGGDGAGGDSRGGSAGASGNAGAGGAAPDGSAGTGGGISDGSAGTGGVATGGSGGGGAAAGSGGGAGATGSGSSSGGGAGGSIPDGSAGAGGAAGSTVVDASSDGPVTCEHRAVDDATGIFVGSFGNDAGNCGGTSNPCASIRQGIQLAIQYGRSHVYVASGTYVEALDLQPGIRIEGGWAAIGAMWTPICKPDAANNDAVVIRAPATNNATITADSFNGEAALAWLTVETKTAANAGESLYGVFVRGAPGVQTTLTLENVSVIAHRGGDGATGAPGAAGSDGATTGCDDGDGANGVTEGAIGDGAPKGMFDRNGYASSAGKPGAPGERGHNGTTSAQPPTCVSSCDSGCRMTPAGACLPTGGYDSCGKAGRAGCGGEPGPGGSGGNGGGSTIGIYAWDASVTIAAGSALAESGANGGAGGTGGPAGNGVAGMAGESGPACRRCGLDAEGCAIGNVDPGVGGGPGGTGGNGTKGGQGGGGSGGFSYAIYKGGTATVIGYETAALSYGNAGKSLSNGAAGQAGTIGPIP